MSLKKEEKLLTESLTIGGRELVLETGELANQANAAVLARCGGTVVLATVVSTSPRDDLDYFPLQVEYVERLYAGGKIKGSRWVKREGRPSDEAVLAGRLVDRAVRPLFPANFKNDTQVVLTVLSVDFENDPVVLSGIATSAALAISDIPWNGPIGFVRIGAFGGNFVINPANDGEEETDLNLVVGVGSDGVLMLEGQGNQIPEEQFLSAIKTATEEGKKIIEAINRLVEKVGRTKVKVGSQDQKLVEKIEKASLKRLKELIGEVDEKGVFKKIVALAEEVKMTVDGVGFNFVKEVVNNLFKKLLRKEIVAGKRPGGRKLEEIRPISIKTGVLPRTHGSAIFQRGETQAMTVATLAGPALKQLIESPEGEEIKRYIHHYFMPPYSVGETGRMMGPGRREIGHGALAEKAIMPVIPSEEEFPYTIRLVSEVLSSNGSTSMASTCGSTLALMDAGVPIKEPVAGISIGLIKEGKDYVLLTDIQGIEDFNGDMDFKVAGTKNGITAVQVDIKVTGLSLVLIEEILTRAKSARMEILEKMLKVIDKPKVEISQYAPKVRVVKIPQESIGGLIGPGGSNIRGMISDTGCEINVDDDGKVTVVGIDLVMVEKAVSRIESIARKPEAGEEFNGTVKRVEAFGAFVEFLTGKEGLVHVSRMGSGFIRSAADVLKVGQEVKVRLDEVDNQGRYNLSLISPRFEGTTSPDQDRGRKY